MATYVQISREEFEGWLSSMPKFRGWKRDSRFAGIYLVPMSDTVAIKISSTVGGSDDALDVGKASMQVRLVSTVNGRVLNKKAQGQSHFARTVNWRKNWVKGLENMHAAYLKSSGFYDALAEIEDQGAYTKEMLARIESIPGWNQNDMLTSFHRRVKEGGILTLKQKAEVMKATEAPLARKPTVDEDYIQRLRELYKAVRREGDERLLNFVTDMAKRLKDGAPLSPKQQAWLDSELGKRRLASRIASAHLTRLRPRG